MGNCIERTCTPQSWDEKLESDTFESFEKELKYHTYNSKEIREKFHQSSVDGKIPDFKFRMLGIAFLNLNKNPKFYSKFLEGEFYLEKKLVCLGVLLGGGEKADKTKILFESYSSGNSGILRPENVREMLEDLIFVACSAIPDHIESQNIEIEELALYVKNLKGITSLMVSRLSRVLLKDKAEISYKEFHNSFEVNSEVASLLISRKLRIYGNKLSETKGGDRNSDETNY